MANDQILEIDVPDLDKVAAALGNMRSKAPTVISKAINRTIKDMSHIMAKEAQAGYWVKIAAVKKTLRIVKSTRSTMSGEVVSSSADRIPLYKFRVSPKDPSPLDPQSVMAQVKKRTGMKDLYGNGDHSKAFIAQMKSGHVGIFQRQTSIVGTKQETARTRSRAISKFRPRDDNPIAEMTGPAIPTMYQSKQLSSEVIKRGREAMHKALDAEVTRVLEANK